MNISGVQAGRLAVVILAFLAGSSPAQESTGSKAVSLAFDRQVKPLLAAYCLDCHGGTKVKGDTDLSTLVNGDAAMRDPSLVRHALAKLFAREMPPSDKRQPSDPERDQGRLWLAALRRLSPPDPGIASVRRLSKAEYANTLHDLFLVDPAIADELPNDLIGAGFTSTLGPLQMEKYLLIADEVLDRVIRPDQVKLSWRAGQLDAACAGKTDPGRPDGAERLVSGPLQLTAILSAPVEGAYTIKIRAASDKLGKEPLRLAVRIGTQVVGEFKISAAVKTPATYSLSAKLPAGRAPFALIVVNPLVQPEEGSEKAKAPAAGPRPPQRPAAPPAKPAAVPAQAATPQPRVLWIDGIEITGPPAAAPTAAQQRIFVASPDKNVDKRQAARRIADGFARRAYRRPPTSAELDVLMAVFDLADRQDEVFSESIKLMLKGVLVSPQFLYLSADVNHGSADEIVRIGDHQLAATLSYLLWSTMPDDELALLADQGRLHDDAVVAAQARRLIADPRMRAFFVGFSAQWLGLDRLATLSVDEKRFPQLDGELRRAMYEEAAQLFEHVLREDHSLVELLDADFTFLNGPLARLYGLGSEIKGPQFRRVALTDPNRGGLLTMPAVLAVTSLPTRTSPVKRGRFVLENILGQPTPSPPMNIPSLDQQNVEANAALNLRQRAERHRADPACAGCHQTMDPLGFGLENFDPLGRWRERDDTGLPVDATGELPGRIAFHEPRDLKRILVARPDEFARALTRQLLSYVLCRSLEGYDDVVVDDLLAASAKDGYRLQSLLVRVLMSYPMLNCRVAR